MNSSGLDVILNKNIFWDKGLFVVIFLHDLVQKYIHFWL